MFSKGHLSTFINGRLIAEHPPLNNTFPPVIITSPLFLCFYSQSASSWLDGWRLKESTLECLRLRCGCLLNTSLAKDDYLVKHWH